MTSINSLGTDLEHGRYLSGHNRCSRPHNSGTYQAHRRVPLNLHMRKICDTNINVRHKLNACYAIGIDILDGDRFDQFSISHCIFSLRLSFDGNVDQSTTSGNSGCAVRLTHAQPNSARHNSRIPSPTKKIRKHRSALRSILRVITYPSISELRVAPLHRVQRLTVAHRGQDGHFIPIAAVPSPKRRLRQCTAGWRSKYRTDSQPFLSFMR